MNSRTLRSGIRQEIWALAHLLLSVPLIVPAPWWNLRGEARFWALIPFAAATVLLGRDLLPARRLSLMPDLGRALPWVAAGCLEFHALFPALAGARAVPAPLYLLAGWLLPARQALVLAGVVAAWTTFFNAGHLSHALLGTILESALFLPAGRFLRGRLPYPQSFFVGVARRRAVPEIRNGEAGSSVLAGGERPRDGAGPFPTDRLDSVRFLADPMEGIRRVLEGVLPACGADLVFYARTNPFRIVRCEPPGDGFAADGSIPDELKRPCEEAYLSRRSVRSDGKGPDSRPAGGRAPGGFAVVPVSTAAGVVGLLGAVRQADGLWEEPVVPMLEQGAFFVGRELELRSRLDGVYWEVARADGIFRQVERIAEAADRSRDGGFEGDDRRVELYRITAEGIRDHLDARRVLLVQVDKGGRQGRVAWEARDDGRAFERREDWRELGDSYIGWVAGKEKPVTVDPAGGLRALPAEWTEVGDGGSILIPVSLPDGFRGVLACIARFGEGEGFNPERDVGRGVQFLNVMRMGISHTAEVERLASEAYTDGLTGLLNRKTFCMRLERVLERLDLRRPCAVIMLDVDHFKRINDGYGHPAGDEVIRTVAGVIDRTVRKVDLAGRYGGEEFVVYLDGTDAKQAVQAAERLRMLIRSTKFNFSGKEVTVSSSLGVACYPVDGTTGDDLLQRADEALYRSKAGGRDRVTLYASSPRGAGDLPLTHR